MKLTCLLLYLVGGLLAVTSVDEEELDPRGDLVASSGYAVDEENGETMTLRFSWFPKFASYKVIGDFDHYLVRHGRVEGWGSRIAEADAQYMTVDKDTESFTMTGVPSRSVYGVQIWALKSDAESIDWNKAWQGTFDFSSWATEDGKEEK